MRICLLYSERAGDGESQGAKLRRSIEEHGHEVVHLVERDTELARALEDPVDLVVAAGGDGTVARAAIALAGQPTPLAVLPLGTANNIARSLGVRGGIDEIVAGWEATPPEALDLGVLQVAETSSFFIEGVGGGLLPQGILAVPPDAHGNDDPTHVKLQRAARRYRDVLAALSPQRWRVVLDEEVREGEYVLVEVLNMSAVGPGLVLAGDVDPHDGWLTVVLADAGHRPALDAYLAAKADGREPHLDLPTVRTRTVELHGLAEAHVDDDVRGWQPPVPLTMRIEPGAVQVLPGPERVTRKISD